jgi:ubiquinone biosynthesis protein UbiJ
MNKRQIALARLAERETQNIAGSCGIFTQYFNEITEGSELAKIEAKMAKIEDQAHALNRRLEKLLAPYTEIDVEEIY